MGIPIGTTGTGQSEALQRIPRDGLHVVGRRDRVLAAFEAPCFVCGVKKAHRLRAVFI